MHCLHFYPSGVHHFLHISKHRWELLARNWSERYVKAWVLCIQQVILGLKFMSHISHLALNKAYLSVWVILPASGYQSCNRRLKPSWPWTHKTTRVMVFWKLDDSITCRAPVWDHLDSSFQSEDLCVSLRSRHFCCPILRYFSHAL